MEKLIDITDRVPARKRKRKIRTNIKFTVLIIIFFLCILGLFYFQSSYSKVKKITVSGNELLEKKSYLDLLQINENDSMWSFKTSDVEENILKNEWVKSVKVKRDLFTTVHVEIEEWSKVAYITNDSTLYPILENGYIYDAKQEELPIDAPVLMNFDDEKLRKKILKQLSQLNPEILAIISQINASPTESDPYLIVLYMNDGYEVRAEISSFAKKLNYYPSIIAQIEQQENFEKGIIDIEVGSYYRPYSGEYDDIKIDNLEEDSTVDEEVIEDETDGE